MQKSYVEYLNVVKKILRYVARIKNLTLKYFKLPSFVLSRFLDSDYEGDRDDKQSTSTYVFNIGSSAIFWASKKHPAVSLSIIEVEY